MIDCYIVAQRIAEYRQNISQKRNILTLTQHYPFVDLSGWLWDWLMHYNALAMTLIYLPFVVLSQACLLYNPTIVGVA